MTNERGNTQDKIEPFGDDSTRLSEGEGTLDFVRIDTLDDEDRLIAEMIRDLPDQMPPDYLVDGVMSAIKPLKMPWWRRLVRWARSPCTLTFTPLQLAPVAAALLAAILVVPFVIKKTQTPSQVPSVQRLGSIPVTFSFRHPKAGSVAVIGSFNGWHPQGFQMKWDAQRKSWELQVRLRAGRYEYAFLVDGKKVVPDPQALLYEEDGFGQKNAVLLLGIDDNDASRA